MYHGFVDKYFELFVHYYKDYVEYKYQDFDAKLFDHNYVQDIEYNYQHFEYY